jgi:SAM-dependent methyltransferase
MIAGDGDNFESNWKSRIESGYLHWTSGPVMNQIQLAFRNHWDYLQEFHLKKKEKGKCIEIGSGRGSLSAYFSADGWQTTLLDVSPSALESAKIAFDKNSLKAEFVEADCLQMPLEDSSFDLVFSVGLWEHFENTQEMIKEQVRILRPGGRLIAYVVPGLVPQIQIDNNWINKMLMELIPIDDSNKSEIYRSSFSHEHYLSEMMELGLYDCGYHWVYPLPLISPSVDFPFTLLAPELEKILVEEFERRLGSKSDRWITSDFAGQAFFVFGIKP